jgi:AmiR/NasT family two-component response regulator
MTFVEVDVERLLAELETLRSENEQLRVALESRVLIEQAKGILAERFFLPPDEAFAALRRASRSQRRKLHEVAHEIVGSTRTPAAVVHELQHGERGREA